MAADSLIGGTSITNTLSVTTKNILNSALNDTQQSTIQTTAIGSATVVQGLGANNEAQGVLVESASPVVGTLSNGDFVVNVNLPANVGLTFEGLNSVVSKGAVSAYLNSLIDVALPAATTDSSNGAALRTSLVNAVDTALAHAGANNVVRLVNVTDSTPSGSAPADLLITAAAGSNNEVVALNMSGIKTGNTVVLGDIGSAVIVGAGTVRVSGSTSAIVVGDNSDQVIIAGTGSDTLVGGGGFDTMVGGSGANTFGFNSAGQYTIQGAGSGDTLGFSIPGITNINQLAALVSDVTVVNNNTTYTFVGGSTITLVGITPDQITAGLIHFTI